MTDPPSAPSPPKPARADDKESERLCNKWVDSALTKNSAIQFLVQHLEDLGCQLPDGFIRCMHCKNPSAGGFGVVEETVLSSQPQVTSKEQCHRSIQDLQAQLQRQKDGTSSLELKPEIYLCQQYMENETQTHKTVVHELIHAIDLCRTNMDPLKSCVQMACTEIRAENLSGECSFFKELLFMNNFAGHGQECVRRRAILSVRANPNCTSHAAEFVDAAMERCFRDVYPFDKHPNQR